MYSKGIQIDNSKMPSKNVLCVNMTISSYLNWCEAKKNLLSVCFYFNTGLFTDRNREEEMKREGKT